MIWINKELRKLLVKFFKVENCFLLEISLMLVSEIILFYYIRWNLW